MNISYDSFKNTLEQKDVFIETISEDGLILNIQNDFSGTLRLLETFRVVYGLQYKILEGSKRVSLSNLDETSLHELELAFLKDEHLFQFTNSGKTFDLKLGISCNNNCVHCVIKPMVFKMKKEYPEAITLNSGTGMWSSKDLTYEEIINILSGTCSDTETYVITGGEPTVRHELPSIVKWIYYNRPKSKIVIQTNGRNLKNEKLVRTLRRYSRGLQFAVALHGLEDTHNKIVNNRIDEGNPYLETVEGLNNLTKYFEPKMIRTEIVLSRQNIDEVYDSCIFQHETLGLTRIGISYPHLDGFPKNFIARLAPTYEQHLKLMVSLNNYIQDKDDLRIYIEETPLCLYNQLEGDIRLESFELFDRSGTQMNFNGILEENFNWNWHTDHGKFDVCKDCIVKDICVGVWHESRFVSENRGKVKPIGNISEKLKEFIQKNIERRRISIKSDLQKGMLEG